MARTAWTAGLRIEQELAVEIDAVRGAESRNAWIAAACRRRIRQDRQGSSPLQREIVKAIEQGQAMSRAEMFRRAGMGATNQPKGK